MLVLPSYRDQSTDLHNKSIDWFLYKGNLALNGLTSCDHLESHLNQESNDVFTLNGRIKGTFVSKLNLGKFNKVEISLLSKGLKFVPTWNHINKAKLKMELEA